MSVADRWVLDHMLLHVTLGMKHVVDELLPSHLAMIDRRLPRSREIVGALPAEAID